MDWTTTGRDGQMETTEIDLCVTLGDASCPVPLALCMAWWHGNECTNSALFNQAYVQVSCHQQGVMNSGWMTAR